MLNARSTRTLVGQWASTRTFACCRHSSITRVKLAVSECRHSVCDRPYPAFDFHLDLAAHIFSNLRSAAISGRPAAVSHSSSQQRTHDWER